MIDANLRGVLARPLGAIARRLHRWGVSPDALTATGFVVGAGACVAAATSWWWLALALWLGNRTIDGLDGPLARLTRPTDRGGFLDLVSDFAIYGGFVVAVAIARPSSRVACAVLLLTYYVNGATLLTYSSLAERRQRERADERSIHFTRGLAEGFETVVVNGLFCVVPMWSTGIAWVFAAMVAQTAVQRLIWAQRQLRD